MMCATTDPTETGNGSAKAPSHAQAQSAEPNGVRVRGMSASNDEQRVDAQMDAHMDEQIDEGSMHSLTSSSEIANDKGSSHVRGSSSNSHSISNNSSSTHSSMSSSTLAMRDHLQSILEESNGSFDHVVIQDDNAKMQAPACLCSSSSSAHARCTNRGTPFAISPKASHSRFAESIISAEPSAALSPRLCRIHDVMEDMPYCHRRDRWNNDGTKPAANARRGSPSLRHRKHVASDSHVCTCAPLDVSSEHIRGNRRDMFQRRSSDSMLLLPPKRCPSPEPMPSHDNNDSKIRTRSLRPSLSKPSRRSRIHDAADNDDDDSTSASFCDDDDDDSSMGIHQRCFADTKYGAETSTNERVRTATMGHSNRVTASSANAIVEQALHVVGDLESATTNPIYNSGNPTNERPRTTTTTAPQQKVQQFMRFKLPLVDT